jgi:CBS domain-containing protein
MKVSEVMSRNPKSLEMHESALHAARLLAKEDIGSIPVHDGKKLVGMVTDRDLVTRVLAEGRQPDQTELGSIVSGDIKYCFDDDDCDAVAANMDQLLVRRLPVVDRGKQLVGMVSIEDIRPRGRA